MAQTPGLDLRKVNLRTPKGGHTAALFLDFLTTLGNSFK